MSVELLQILSIISFIIAAVLFVVSIALFFILDIAAVYGDLSGRTARKAINAIHNQNKNEEKSSNVMNSNVTDKITLSGRQKDSKRNNSIGVGTEKFATATLITAANETTVLNNAANETTLLNTSANETTVLTAGPTYKSTDNVIPKSETGTDEPVFADFVLEVEMSFTGSSEIIE